LERQLLGKLKRGRNPLNGLLKTKPLPYQERGAIFAACRGRVVLADDVGLGKTVQPLAATEMLRRRRGIQRVLVVAPASVKYQWKTEIEKFTDLPAQVIEGLLPRRRQLYAMKEVSESFQRLCGTPNFTNQQRESIKEVIRRVFMPDLPKLGYYDRS
jgi:SNF2 family DNA or RNA helicase